MKKIRFEYMDGGNWKTLDLVPENNLPLNIEEYLNQWSSLYEKNKIHMTVILRASIEEGQ